MAPSEDGRSARSDAPILLSPAAGRRFEIVDELEARGQGQAVVEEPHDRRSFGDEPFTATLAVSPKLELALK